MNATERAKRSDSLHYDNVPRRALCDRIANLESDLEDTKAENAKLREELAKARNPQRIGGQADPSSFVYAIEQLREFRWQHATNDEDAIPYINNVVAAHERENAKLRERAVILRQGRWSDGPEDAELMEHAADAIEQLERKNAKLRELVRIAVKHCDSGTCDGCPIMGKDESCPYSDMACELGVEVDV